MTRSQSGRAWPLVWGKAKDSLRGIDVSLSSGKQCLNRGISERDLLREARKAGRLSR